MSNAQGTPVMSGNPQGGATSPILAALLSRMGQGGFSGGMFGGPQTQMQPMHGPQGASPQGQGQYQASPAAQSQIQSLLSGTASNPFAGAGAVGGLAGASRTPGMLMAQSLIPTTKEGGAQGPVGGFFGSLMGGSNRSPIGDIAGALALGLPISDESWRAAGYGPGGSPLGG